LNLDSSASDDNDSDNVPNGEELEEATNPTEPDSDFDGLTDRVELDGPTDPTNPDTDGDLLLDGGEVNGDPATDPLLADTDLDSFSDSLELNEGSDPTDIGDVPIAFIGQTPVGVEQVLRSGASYANTYVGLNVIDATFRLCVDLEAKVDGEREILFETGGGGNGLSLVYEAGNQLVLRSAGSGALAEVFYTLTASEVSAGDKEIVFTYDVADEADEDGRSTISLFVDGMLVGADSDALDGNWSGANNSGFGIVASGIAGVDGGGDLTAVNFASGAINLHKGLQFYSGVLFVESDREVKITAVSYDGTILTITFDSNAGENYSVEESSDMTSWQEVDDPSGTGPTTTVQFPYDTSLSPQIFLRVRVLPN
jgi:hypothetical protein